MKRPDEINAFLTWASPAPFSLQIRSFDARCKIPDRVHISVHELHISRIVGRGGRTVNAMGDCLSAIIGRPVALFAEDDRSGEVVQDWPARIWSNATAFEWIEKIVGKTNLITCDFRPAGPKVRIVIRLRARLPRRLANSLYVTLSLAAHGYGLESSTEIIAPHD